MNEVNSDKSDEPEETLFNASSSSASESEMEGMSVFVGSMNTFSDDPSHTRLTYLKKTKPKIRLRSWDACLNQFCATPGSSFDFTTQFRNVSHLFPTSYLPAWNDEDFNVDDIFQPSTNQWEPNSLQPPQPDLSPSAAPDRLSNVLRCGTTDGRVNRKGWIYLPSTKASSDKCCSGGTKECHSSTMLSTLYEKDTCNIKDTGIRASFDCDIDRLYNNRVRRASVDSETTELMNRDSSETEFCSSQLDCEDREKKTSRRRVSDRKRSENRNMCRKKGDEVGEFNGIKEEDATEIIDEIKKLEEDDELKDVDRVYDAHEVKEEDEEFKDINRMEAVGYTDEIKKVEEDDEMEDFEEHKYFDAYDEEDDEDYVKEEVEEHDDEYEYQELEDGEAEKLIEDMRMFELQLQERGPRFLLQFGYDDGDEEYESEDDDDGDAGGHDGHDDDDDENEEDEEDEDDDGEDENDEDNEEEEEEEEEGEQSEVDEEEEEEIGEEDEEEVEIEVEINENDDEEEREGEVRIQEVVEEEDDVENEEHDEIEGMEEEDEGEEEEKDEEVKMEEVVKEKRKDLFGTRFDEEIDEKRKRYEDMTSYLFEPDEYNDSEFGAERTVIPIYREDVMNPPGVQMDDPILYDAYMEYVKNEAGEDMEESEETEKRLEEIHLIYLKRREEEAAEYAKTKNQEPGFLEDEESRSKLAEDLELGADFFKKKSEQQPEEQDTKDEEYNHNDTDEEDHRNNNELKQPSNDGGDSESDESENVDYRCKRYYSKIFKDDDSDSDETESSEECEDEFVDVDECEEDNSVESHYGKYEDDEHRFEHDYHVGEISIPSEIHEERYISEQQSARSYASSEEMNTENVNREPNSPEIDVCESYAYDSQGNGEYHNSEDMQYDEYQRLGTEDFPPLVYNDSQAAETSDGVSSEHQLSADYRNFIEPVDDDDYPSDEFKGYEPVEVGEYESGVVDELGYQELEEYGPAEFEPHLSFEIHEDRLTGMVGESNENVESLQLELERLNDCRSTDHELIDVDTTILNASVCEVLVSDTAEQLGINTENHELVEHNNSQVDGTNNPGRLKQHLPQEQCSTLPLISLEDSSRSSLITCEDGLSTNYAGHASGLEEQRIDSLEQEEISSYPCNDHILPSTMLDGPVREQIEVAFCEQPMSSSNEFNNESKRRTRTNEKYPVVKKSSGNVGNSDGDHTATSETRRGCDALHKLSVSSGRKRQNCVLHCCSDYIPKPSEKKTNRASRPSRRNKMEMIVDDKDSSDNTQRYLRASYGSDDEDHVGESYFCTENADIVVDLQDPDTDTEEPTVEFNDESKETRHLLRTYTAPDRVPGSGISRTTHTKKPECKRSVEAMVIESLKESREKYNNKTSKVDFSRSSKQASVYGYH